MRRSDFRFETGSGELSGWVTGEGPPVLAIHGGPGLSYGYLDAAVMELADGYRVATYQQRGLAPSTTEGAFTIAEALADIVAVLDGLGWESAHLMGHSWGGHLALHAAVEIPERVSGVLAVDPLGAVGDGGMAAFNAEMEARMPPESFARVLELDEKDAAGIGTAEESMESLSLVWPPYFADPSAAPPMPRMEISHPAMLGLLGEVATALPALEARLPSITRPVGLLLGERSPMPVDAGLETAARISGAWTRVAPGAGHFVWYEAPGAVIAAMDDLVTSGADVPVRQGPAAPGGSRTR
jgi:pimeloyl-ACP methyl ester carboxylesterase